jgi:hypothetical protein
MAKDIDEQMEAEQKAIRRKYRQWDKKNTISWIERLADTPIEDARKFCIWRVFVPYLINVRGLSRVDASDRIKTWLDKCNIISRLNFDPKSKIDDVLNNVGSYYPISRARLERENNPLYTRLVREGVLKH